MPHALKKVSAKNKCISVARMRYSLVVVLERAACFCEVHLLLCLFVIG